MGNIEFEALCTSMVRRYMEKIGLDHTDDDVYVVWMTKVLQNNKAMLSTTHPDTRYYEVTYNGDADEFYLDVYIKEANHVLKV